MNSTRSKPREAPWTAAAVCRLLFVLASTCLICSVPARAAGILDNDPNLVLHYDFETQLTNGTVIDTSAYGNNGVQFNTTNYLSYTYGVFGGTAAQYSYVGTNGTPPTLLPYSQYIAVTNLQGFFVMTNATISVWLQFAPNYNNSVVSIVDCGFNYALISNSFPSGSNSWSFGRYGNFDKNLTFWVYPTTNNGALKILTWPNNDGGAFSTTRLHLYTVTIDCVSNIATAYMDGTNFMTGAVGVPNLRIFGCKTLRWLCVGAFCHNGTPQWADAPDAYPNDGYFAGRMDDLRIYNRTLSASEVKALYCAARSVTVISTAPQQVQISWRGLSNVSYQLESCNDLSAQLWSPVGAPVLSAGGVDSRNDTPAASTSFYRVTPLQ